MLQKGEDCALPGMREMNKQVTHTEEARYVYKVERTEAANGDYRRHHSQGLRIPECLR